MNYELAKELKDAGFPQSEGRPLILPGNVLLSVVGDEHNNIESVTHEDGAYLPTLSELIESCGDVVLYANVNIPTLAYCDEKVGEGSTPEEAVARLWLSLKK